MRILVLILLQALLITPLFADEVERAEEFWQGTFKQKGLVEYEGPFTMLLTYYPGEDYPQRLMGVIHWVGESLGGAKTKILGSRTERGIKFQEIECLERCQGVLLGGRYQARFDGTYTRLEKGKAQHPGTGLRATFEMKRILGRE